MTPEEAKEIIKSGASEDILFIEQISSASQLNQYIEQLSNKEKAYIFIGVKDCGTVKGIKNKGDLLEYIYLSQQERSQTILKPIEIKLVRSFTILILQISPLI